MELRLLRLENRLLFDASAVAAIVAQGDAGNGGEGDAAHNADVAADSGEPVAENQTESSDTGEPSIVDAPADATDSGTHVLVVATDVESYEGLVSSAADNVIVVTYDPAAVTLNKIIDKIDVALDGKLADSIGFATHGADGTIALTQYVWATDDSVSTVPKLQQFWSNLGELVKDGGRIDLLGCYIANDGAALLYSIDSLLDLSGKDISVAASVDLTGNEPVGDWILEAGGVDAMLYFNYSELNQWTGSWMSRHSL